MIMSSLLSLTTLWIVGAATSPQGAELAPTMPPWAESMRAVHERSSARPGTFAHFGDSITVSMAFWAPLPLERKYTSPEMERAFLRVQAYMRPECWRDWKGPEYGNEGRMTLRWADAHLESWLDRLQPETVLIMFGSNDLQVMDLEEYQRTLRSIVERCLARGIVVIMNTIPPRSGFVQKSAAFAEAARSIARDLHLPLVDYHAEILRRRPNDWDGSSEAFGEWSGYDVPTLISRDGVHPSHPVAYRNDYSEEALNRCGFSLRNALVLLKYAQVIETVLQPEGDAATVPDTLKRGEPLIEPPHESWFPKAPPLPSPREPTIRVATVDELFSAVERASPGETILLADGLYAMPRTLEIHTDNLTLRGESGRRETVVLDGSQSRHGELVGFRHCSDVTVADLTIQNIRWNGFKVNSDSNVQRLTLYNCIIHNIWQRGVKGVKVPEAVRETFRPRNFRIQYCLFYNDRPKQYRDDPADTPQNFGGNYVGGIDVMYAKEWVISDNVFLGIHGRTGGARGAIFLWHETEDCVVERNIIIDCDTGIALGNSHRPPDVPTHCRRVLVRNNFVTRAHESGIVADYTEDCRIVHNTIHDPESRLKRLIRLVHDNDGLVVRNNLLSGPPMRVETESAITFDGNITRDLTEAFADPAGGNLHLRAPLGGIVGEAKWSFEATEDIDWQPRGPRTTPGADEPGSLYEVPSRRDH